MSDKNTKALLKAAAAIKPTTTPALITEETAIELAKQMKRVADAMDRQYKFMMVTGGKDKLQEMIDSKKA